MPPKSSRLAATSCLARQFRLHPPLFLQRGGDMIYFDAGNIDVVHLRRHEMKHAIFTNEPAMASLIPAAAYGK